jgi:hypothetical protein
MRFLLHCMLWLGLLLVATGGVQAQSFGEKNDNFFYSDHHGRVNSARVIRHYYRRTVMHPPAKVDPRVDPRLRRAATIAEERANAKSKALCWRYVKQALVSAGVVSSYPKTNYACDAGDELVHNFGFKKIAVQDPYAAPVGAVLVYGGRGAGHVEIRTRDGFVSDYHSKSRCFYPLRAAYVKF